MKSKPSYKYILLALLLLLTGSIVMAQNVESEPKKQNEIRTDEMESKMESQKALQAEEMNKRKKMLEEPQVEMREIERQYDEQARIMDRSARESSRARASSRARESSSAGESYRVRSATPSSAVYADGYYFIGSHDQETQSQLTLRKSFRETTSTSKGEFDVEPGIRNFRCMISGSVRSGEIVIGIKYPNGKTFKELTINPSADINFSQSISIKEGQDKKYVGSWNYVIKAAKAQGDYMVQIMTK